MTDTHLPEPHNSHARRKKSPLRKRLGVFLVCFLISAVMWLFIQLTKDYSWELKYNIEFTNIPKGLALTDKSDTSMRVSVTAQGFDLLFETFFNRNRLLNIDLSQIRSRQNGEKFTSFLTSQQLKELIGDQLGFQKNITYIHPDTIYFKFSEIDKKRIRIHLNLDYTLDNSCRLYDSITLLPQLATVFSIKQVLDTLRFIETQKIVLANLDTTITQKILLKRTLSSNMISFTPDSVLLTIPVRRYTEAKFILPVRMGSDSTSARIIPAKVEVTCLVPQSELSKINESLFVVQAINLSSDASRSNVLKVNVSKLPPHVYFISVSPEMVEYGGLKK